MLIRCYIFVGTQVFTCSRVVWFVVYCVVVIMCDLLVGLMIVWCCG